jgi:hypothetical protein
MGRKKESCFNWLVKVIVSIFCLALIIGMYILLGVHVYAYIKVVCPLLKKRLGTQFGLTWAAIGVIFTYNILYNHTLAMIIRPGGPIDTKYVERMRIRDK